MSTNFLIDVTAVKLNHKEFGVQVTVFPVGFQRQSLWSLFFQFLEKSEINLSLEAL